MERHEPIQNGKQHTLGAPGIREGRDDLFNSDNCVLKTSQEAGVGVQMRVGKKTEGKGRREELKIHYGVNPIIYSYRLDMGRMKRKLEWSWLPCYDCK